MSVQYRKYDLEDRLVGFACMCLGICNRLPKTRVGFNLEHQLSRSCTAPALLYGEAQAAESRQDFIHKMSISLKELRETRVNLRIIMEHLILESQLVQPVLNEANELIAIFTSSIKSAKKK